MTDRERQLIEAYIPSPRDPNLGEDEYYVMDTAGRVQRGWLTDIAPNTRDDCNVYRVRNKKGTIYSAYSNELGYMPKTELYDNKEDCKNRTHACYSRWEHLRELQKKESEQCQNTN